MMGHSQRELSNALAGVKLAVPCVRLAAPFFQTVLGALPAECAEEKFMVIFQVCEPFFIESVKVSQQCLKFALPFADECQRGGLAARETFLQRSFGIRDVESVFQIMDNGLAKFFV
jgi:hypothetical protein